MSHICPIYVLYMSHICLIHVHVYTDIWHLCILVLSCRVLLCLRARETAAALAETRASQDRATYNNMCVHACAMSGGGYVQQCVCACMCYVRRGATYNNVCVHACAYVCTCMCVCVCTCMCYVRRGLRTTRCVCMHVLCQKGGYVHYVSTCTSYAGVKIFMRTGFRVEGLGFRV